MNDWNPEVDSIDVAHTPLEEMIHDSIEAIGLQADESIARCFAEETVSPHKASRLRSMIVAQAFDDQLASLGYWTDCAIRQTLKGFAYGTVPTEWLEERTPKWQVVAAETA